MRVENLVWKKEQLHNHHSVPVDETVADCLASAADAVMEESLLSDLPDEAQEDFRLVSEWISTRAEFLRESPGFIIPQLPEEWSDLRLRYGYSLICRALGKLNDRYGYFFDVKDQGLDYKKEAVPVSKTRDSTGFHTDSTASSYYPDFVGLLCLHPAEDGGDSLLSNAANLYDYIRLQHPGFLDVLTSGLLRDVITPGSVQDKEAILANKVPVFQEDAQGFLFRYMRFWTEKAYEKTGSPIPSGLIESLNAVDNFFNQDSNILSFRMKRGDILLINNRFLCHNRTAFSEPGPGKPARLLVRAWINLA